MGKSQETFGKKEREKKRKKKKDDKAKKKVNRKENAEGGTLDDMIKPIYYDENGHMTDTPPDPMKKKVEIEAEDIVLGIPKKVEEYFNPNRKGRVEFFNDSKGFGFIKDLDNQEKYFVHVNGLIDNIAEGDKVTYELEKGMKGMNAVRVKQA